MPQSQTMMFRDTDKSPSAISQTEHAKGLFGRVSRRKPLLVKRKQRCVLGLQSCIWSVSKTSGTMSFGLTKVEMFDHHTQHHIWWKPNTSNQLSGAVVNGSSFVIVLLPHALRVVGVIEANTSSSSIPKCCRIKREVVFLAAKAWPKSGRATTQLSQELQQSCKKRSESYLASSSCYGWFNKDSNHHLVSTRCFYFLCPDIWKKLMDGALFFEPWLYIALKGSTCWSIELLMCYQVSWSITMQLICKMN